MPKFKQFCTPHCHPQSLDSGSTPAAFAKREVELGSGAITCTDHGSLAAAYDVYSLGKKHGLTSIIGLEGYFRDDDCDILKRLGVPKTDTVPRGMDRERWLAEHPTGSFYDYLKYLHVTLHAIDYEGYLCMVRLLSRADARAEQHGSERKPLFSWADLEELAAHNVTATSSCLVGMIQRHLVDQENQDAALAYFQRMKHLFKDRFYVEVFPHVCSHNWVNKVFVDVVDQDGNEERLRFYMGKKLRTSANEKEGVTAEDLAARYDPGQHRELLEVMNYRKWTPFEKKYTIKNVTKVQDYVQNECTAMAPDGDIQWGTNRYVMELAEQHQVPVLIADDSHFAHPEEKAVQDARLAQLGDWKFWGSYHRQSSDEAWAYFRDRQNVPEATFEGWVQNTIDWASRFKGFKFDATPKLPTNFYPSATLEHTKRLILEHGRVLKRPEYMARLKAELDLLHRNGTIDLLPYFFLGEEVCSFYERQGWLTGPGRGSAAGLLMTYLLGITHVDPLKYGLSMERFLTVDRIRSGKLPDIDQDLPFRDPLVGWATDVLEFEAEDGTRHIVPETLVVKTDKGAMTIREALAAGAELEPWWLERNKFEV